MSDLLPVEAMALTVALAQLRRGEDVTPNITAMCVLALGRLDGRLEPGEWGDDD